MPDVVMLAREHVGARQAVPNIDELQTLVKGLKGKFEFTLARDLLALSRPAYKPPAGSPSGSDAAFVWVVQQQALCTYKDETIQAARRFEEAHRYLLEIGLDDSANGNTETLALGGSIFKRRYELLGQLDDLHRSYGYYFAAWERDPDADKGYGGINAAYVLDVLAQRMESLGQALHAEEAKQLRDKATALRSGLVDYLKRMYSERPAIRSDYFFLVTLAEAYYGLDEFEHAAKWLTRAHAVKSDEWELQTTARQFASLAQVRGYSPPGANALDNEWAPPWWTLKALLGEDARFVFGGPRSKLGLALSGGGFRSSFFHIGVMARLAEMNILRCVEVLSTVSGGSILGAHYYLKLRQLLQTKPDGKIDRSDYIQLIGELSREFFAGVQRNLRMSTFANVLSNLQMLCSWPLLKYRTIRLGRLYERYIYANVPDGHSAAAPRKMRELLITPCESRAPAAPSGGGQQEFNPRFQNWRRRAKVPSLVINATSLNSGHAWHFNAKGMGEPPALVGEEVDMKPRYRRAYYAELDEARAGRLRTSTFTSVPAADFPLGCAVGASSCVPALFGPIEIDKLYSDRTVRLIDGGVHDNQGLQGLLAEGCGFIICSDGSGQIVEQKAPRAEELKVLHRANDTIMERVRESTYQHLNTASLSHGIEGFCFVHLKKDLDIELRDWAGAKPRSPAPAGGRTCYGIDKDLQRLISGIRTDLDVFTEVEAYALMASGYLMTAHEFGEDDSGKPINRPLRQAALASGFNVDAAGEDWEFRQLESLLGEPADSVDPRRRDLALQLEVGANMFFKVWHLYPALRGLGSRWTKWTLAVTALTSVALALWNTDFSFTFIWKPNGQSLVFAACWLVAAVIALTIGVTVIINGHRLLFDWLYRRRGCMRRLFNLPRTALAGELKEKYADTSYRPPEPVAPHKVLLSIVIAFGMSLGVLPFFVWSAGARWIGLALVVAGIWVWVMWRSRRFTATASDPPGPVEWLLACWSAVGYGALTSLMGFISFGAAYLLAKIVLAGAHWVAWPLDFDPGQPAAYFSWAFCAPFFVAALAITADKLPGKLYPSVAGTRSVFYPLALRRGTLWLSALGVAGGLIVLFLISDLQSWPFAFLVSLLLTFSSARLFSVGEPERSTAAPALEARDLVQKLFSAAGYRVVERPRTGKPEVDPLIASVDFLATSASQGYAIEVKVPAEAELDWLAAVPVRSAAKTLERTLRADSDTAMRIEPLLFVVGGALSEDIRAFAAEEAVVLRHFPQAAPLHAALAATAGSSVKESASAILQVPAGDGDTPAGAAIGRAAT